MGLLYASESFIQDNIVVRIPTVGEILDNEQEYYSNVALLTATPYEMMVQLDELHMDFTEIDEWGLFCILFREIQRRDFRMVFRDLDFKNLTPIINKDSHEVVFVDKNNEVAFDRIAHLRVSRFLRNILCIDKKDKRPANQAAKDYMLERARTRMSRARKKVIKSQLEEYIVALVNTKEFPYDYDSVRGITIYQFNRSLRQIIKKIDYDNLMIGCYAGTVDMEKVDQNKLTWI